MLKANLFYGGALMLHKIRHTLAAACILFTSFVFLLYAAGLVFVGSTITFTLEGLLLLFALCILIALSNSILHAQSLALPIVSYSRFWRMNWFLIFIWIGDFIQNAVGALIAFVLITLLYAVFAVPFVFFERKKRRNAQNQKSYQSIFKN